MDDISIDVPLDLIWGEIYGIYRNKFSEEEYTMFREFLISVCGINLVGGINSETSIVEEEKWMIFQLTYL